MYIEYVDKMNKLQTLVLSIKLLAPFAIEENTNKLLSNAAMTLF